MCSHCLFVSAAFLQGARGACPSRWRQGHGRARCFRAAWGAAMPHIVTASPIRLRLLGACRTTCDECSTTIRFVLAAWGEEMTQPESDFPPRRVDRGPLREALGRCWSLDLRFVLGRSANVDTIETLSFRERLLTERRSSGFASARFVWWG